MTSRIFMVTLATALAVLFSGCGGAMGALGMGKYDINDVRKALNKDDSAALKRMCDPKTPAKTENARKFACDSYAPYEVDERFEAAVANSDQQEIEALCKNNRDGNKVKARTICQKRDSFEDDQFMAKVANCDTMHEAWEKWGGKTKNTTEERYFAWGKKVVECGEWNRFWTEVVHHGTDLKEPRGTKLLAMLEHEGKPVEAKLMEYLKANATSPFGFEHGEFATNNVVIWLLNTGKTAQCETFLPYAQSSKHHGYWLNYFAEAGCTKAAPMAEARLSHEDPKMRSHACWVLGKIGNNASAKKMKSVATTDPVWEVGGDNTKVYWVRDACQKAINQVKSR